MANAKTHINMALQGGGAHGAFTWGVLDVVLRDEDIVVDAFSGTSAGALNAAAVKAGIVQNGRQGALDNLDWVWSQVGAISDPVVADWVSSMSPAAPIFARALEASPIYATFDMATRLMSPYLYGEAFKNPLERIVRDLHFEDVCAPEGPSVYIGATNVRSGKIRVFSGLEITPEAIMASACLPTLFQAVEFEDPATGEMEAFWDGGYTGNPALFPLFEPQLPNDILIVNINPLYRAEVPKNTQAIQNRINEISFNSSLFRELRAIEFVQRLIAEGTIEQGKMKKVFVHMIADDELMNDLNVATKTIPTPVILEKLKSAGQAAAKNFLSAHKGSLNKGSTVDLKAMFS